MQVIFAFHGDPEDYVFTDAHLKVCRPRTCPNCMESDLLRALGYYSRWVWSNKDGAPGKRNAAFRSRIRDWQPVAAAAGENNQS